MYITKSLIEGLKILGFDKETIKNVAREKNLEEIFLSTLFLNYLMVLIIYLLGILTGGFSIEGREINMTVFFGLLMIYPFVYNLAVYGIYGFFGAMAELLDKRKHIKPLISVGFHTAVVYSIVLYVIGLLTLFDINYGIFMFVLFMIYFIYTMFLAIKEIYEYSQGQIMIILFIPFTILFLALMTIYILLPDLGNIITTTLFK